MVTFVPQDGTAPPARLTLSCVRTGLSVLRSETRPSVTASHALPASIAPTWGRQPQCWNAQQGSTALPVLPCQHCSASGSTNALLAHPSRGCAPQARSRMIWARDLASSAGLDTFASTGLSSTAHQVPTATVDSRLCSAMTPRSCSAPMAHSATKLGRQM